MILQDLKIHNVRNLKSLQCNLNPRFTVLVGDNGCGKTSFLEALCVLGRGYSFRSREIAPIITFSESLLTVFARGQDNTSISVQKSKTAPTIVKLNNQFCSSSSQLAYALPMQVFYQDLFDIMDAGSGLRRGLLDWGLFHVKHGFLSVWKDYKRVLQQRNALLKQQAKPELLVPWNALLSELSLSIHELRQSYFLDWQQSFEKVLYQLTDLTCSIEYFKGWDKKESGLSLLDVLRDVHLSDIQRGYTQYGAHQADIFIKTHGLSAKKILSRGQQKMLVIALKLSQADLLDQDCLYLLDDYTSELDIAHQRRLLDFLYSRKGQYILTTSHKQASSLFADTSLYSVITLEDGKMIA